MEISKRNLEKYKSLSERYAAELKENSKGPIDPETLFDGDQARDFIMNKFSEEAKNKKIKDCINLITPFRAKHTVSAYLLGIIIRNNLKFDTRNWRRLPHESSPSGSFMLFWAWICLFHDIGYHYETTPKHFVNCSEIDELITELNIKHNLLSFSSNPELIRKYYRMRISGKKPVLDHGIVGALLLFDALMDLSESEKIYSEIRQYRRFYAKICDTIAIHNMWRASDQRITEYDEFELYELIPSPDNHHIVFYKDDSLLFLLGLVDSIDPIKYFCRDNRYKQPVSHRDILPNVSIAFFNYSTVKEFRIWSDSSYFEEYANALCDPKRGLPTWLGVTAIHPKNSNHLSILIDTKGSFAAEAA